MAEAAPEKKQAMIYILLILYASMHGVDNGMLYSRKGSTVSLKLLDKIGQNEHALFVIERGCLFLMPLIVGFYCVQSWLYEIPVEVIAGAFAFSYFHNGFKNITLDELQNTNGGWSHTSPDSEAKINFNYPVRLGMLVVSFGILIYGYLWL